MMFWRQIKRGKCSGTNKRGQLPLATANPALGDLHREWGVPGTELHHLGRGRGGGDGGGIWQSSQGAPTATLGFVV
jgi:hypothetical protein